MSSFKGNIYYRNMKTDNSNNEVTRPGIVFNVMGSKNEVKQIVTKNEALSDGEQVGFQPPDVVIHENDNEYVPPQELVATGNARSIDINSEVLNNLVSVCKSLQGNLYTVMTEMKELKRQSSENNAKLNKIIRILKKENESAVNDDNKVNILDTTITPVLFPLNDRESIERFDLDLCGNNDFKDKMINHLSKIGGVSGLMDGFKIAYKLVDYMFTSDILVQYSWTGLSKEPGVVKDSFQKYENIIRLFQRVVQLADSRYTAMRNELFFKEKVLKHSKKRSKRKRPMKYEDMGLMAMNWSDISSNN